MAPNNPYDLINQAWKIAEDAGIKREQWFEHFAPRGTEIVKTVAVQDNAQLSGVRFEHELDEARLQELIEQYGSLHLPTLRRIYAMTSALGQGRHAIPHDELLTFLTQLIDNAADEERQAKDKRDLIALREKLQREN